MSALSDRIEQWLKERLDEEEGTFRFTRNLLAEQMNCVPSQITYVLSTRFTNSQGYLIESKRGGGGSIQIRRIDWQEPAQYIMHTVNTLEDSLSQSECRVLLTNLHDANILNEESYRLFRAALSNNALAPLEPLVRDRMRARLFANMLTSLLAGQEEKPDEEA